jgi:hypothetical protein
MGRKSNAGTGGRLGVALTGPFYVAEEVHADLIVVGNRGMRGARRMLGSIPNHISHHAACDVLVVDTVDGVRPLA